jgi:hypothetical protein
MPNLVAKKEGRFMSETHPFCRVADPARIRRRAQPPDVTFVVTVVVPGVDRLGRDPDTRLKQWLRFGDRRMGIRVIHRERVESTKPASEEGVSEEPVVPVHEPEEI